MASWLIVRLITLLRTAWEKPGIPYLRLEDDLAGSGPEIMVRGEEEKLE